MSIIAELKRRNVFRVGIAYLVLGWVVIQVTDTVGPAINLPEWTLTIVTWLGVIGFPFALLFAWAFELTPDGLKREHEVDRSASITPHTGRKVDFAIIGLLLLAVGFLLLDRSSVEDAPVVEPSVSPVVAEVASTEAEQSKAYDSIAVLPFHNMSDDPAQEFFSDGIAEELLNALARLRNLKVAARTSSFAFKGKQTDIREIGAALNVATVLEGSLRKSGTRLRITAQLIDVETGYHLWSEVYDRELTDVFAVQDDITAQIMSALQVHLESGETAQVTSTTNPQAYEAYMKGRQGLHQRTLESIEEAESLFELATALDDEFALAWAGQALAVHLQSIINYGDLPVENTRIRSDALVNRALALEPELAEAHAVRSLNYLNDGRPQDALEALDRAIASSPGVAEFHLWRSSALNLVGRREEANSALDRAFVLDPLHPSILASRVQRACTYGWLPVTEAMFESLAPYPQMQARSRMYCNFDEGELALAFKQVEDSESGIAVIARMVLKDCDTPWNTGVNVAESAFPQAMYCQGDEAAMALYQGLSELQKKDQRVRDYLSIIQLRQKKYAESLATLNEIYNNSLDVADLDAFSIHSGSNLNLNRVLMLQRLGRMDEAARVLAHEQRVLEQAKLDGMQRGYHMFEAKINLLSGNREAGLQALDVAFRSFEIDWRMRFDPVLAELVGPEKLAVMTRWLDAHVDAERAKLGWPAAGF